MSAFVLRLLVERQVNFGLVWVNADTWAGESPVLDCFSLTMSGT